MRSLEPANLIRMIRSTLLVAILLVIRGWDAFAQQRSDSAFSSTVRNPTYALGQGPTVLIDEAHHNFHTAGGRYAAFADLLRKDGYRVSPSTNVFSREVLERADILVIANALHESNRDAWKLPTPSAFAAEEIRSVSDWLKSGGSLLLIADHMPFPGAAAALGRELGFAFGNGYARGPDKGVFRRSDGLLKEHPITTGGASAEKITAVRTFTGQAFQSKGKVEPILVFGDGHYMLLPERANRFDDDTLRVDVNGWLHAAVRRIGKGRVAVFGEAAMFTAQISSSRKPMGMNAPGAGQNRQLCLNVMHWLSGLLEPDKVQR